MVSWLLIPAVSLGVATGLPAAMATTDPIHPTQVVEPVDANPLEAYQHICQTEARHQGAPEAVARGSCRCLQQRLEALEQPPHGRDDLKAFTEENRLACVFQAILEL